MSKNLNELTLYVRTTNNTMFELKFTIVANMTNENDIIGMFLNKASIIAKSQAAIESSLLSQIPEVVRNYQFQSIAPTDFKNLN